jgi:hypothetical protein
MTGFAIQSTRALLSFPSFVNSRVVIAANTHIACSLLKRESSA